MKLPLRESLALAILLPTLAGCREFWCWPFCKDAEQEAVSTDAIGKHCQKIGDNGPDGGHIKLYNACMREAGLK